MMAFGVAELFSRNLITYADSNKRNNNQGAGDDGYDDYHYEDCYGFHEHYHVHDDDGHYHQHDEYNHNHNDKNNNPVNHEHVHSEDNYHEHGSDDGS